MRLPQLVLASASPARKRLLESLGLLVSIQPSYFDEASIETATPEQLVQTLAHAKAAKVAAEVTMSGQPTLVLGCDSVLVLKGQVHGKPVDATEAIARWQQMRGQVGTLLTGHALLDLETTRTLVEICQTQVYFADASDAEIRAYVATGEPLNCAGCFTLEGKGGALIDKIEGCYSNVIGLSLPLLRRMLAELGYSVADFWPSESSIGQVAFSLSPGILG